MLGAIATSPGAISEGTRYEAAEALRRLGQIDALHAIAENEVVEAWVRAAAAESLAQLGRPALANDILGRIAKDESIEDWMRATAVETLGRLGRSSILSEITADEALYIYGCGWTRRKPLPLQGM